MKQSEELEIARARLCGLGAAQKAIDGLIDEARKACQPNGPRQRRSLAWWQGHFSGLVLTSAMLALADFPNVPANAAQIKKILSVKKP